MLLDPCLVLGDAVLMFYTDHLVVWKCSGLIELIRQQSLSVNPLSCLCHVILCFICRQNLAIYCILFFGLLFVSSDHVATLHLDYKNFGISYPQLDAIVMNLGAVSHVDKAEDC